MGLQKESWHISLSLSLSWIHDKSLPRELCVEEFQCACHVINYLPPWPSKEKTPFEFLYDQKPNVSNFWVFVVFAMFMFINKIEPRFVRKQRNVCLLVMIHTGKCGNSWI